MTEPFKRLLVSRAEAAATIDISVRTLDALLQNPDSGLHPVKIGRSTKVRVSDLERFVKRGSHATKVAA